MHTILYNLKTLERFGLYNLKHKVPMPEGKTGSATVGPWKGLADTNKTGRVWLIQTRHVVHAHMFPTYDDDDGCDGDTWNP